MSRTRPRSDQPAAPLIGLTGRRFPGSTLPLLEGRYQKHSFDMHFSAFPAAVAAAGGLPVELPYEAGRAAVVERLDGIVITGGQDVEPTRWGGDPMCAVGQVDPTRDAYELDVINAALELNIPILGVCRGMQLINVALGGTLVPHLANDVIDHTAPGQGTGDRVHTVATVQGSVASALFGEEVAVNSLHHQAVDAPGRGLVVTGRAADRTAEALEMPGRPVLGVQWHPEWLEEPDGSFQWLINAATDRAFGCIEAC